jgi:exopolyphosphatase/guanosine-5'-triphosphate,3'-diphosphate pyrophosphatase
VVVLQQLAILLRLAILFHRGATPLTAPPGLTVSGKKLVLALPLKWLTEMPLMAADLEQEQEWITPDFCLQW